MRSYLLIGIFAATTAFFQPAIAGVCGCADDNSQCIEDCGHQLKACVFNCGITTVNCYTGCVERVMPPKVTEVASKVSKVIHAIPTVSAVIANPEGAISYAISEAVSSAVANSPFSPVIHSVPLATITPASSDEHDSDEDEEKYDDDDDDDDYEDCDDDEDEKYDDDNHDEGKPSEDKPSEDKPSEGNPDAIVASTTERPTPTIVDAIRSAIVSTALPSIGSYVEDKVSSAVHNERERIDEIIQRQREHFLNSVSSRLFAHPTPAILADIDPLPTNAVTSRDIDPTIFAALDPSALANNPEVAAALKAAGLPSDPATISAMMESGALPSDPAAIAAMLQAAGISVDPSEISAAMGADAAPTDTASQPDTSSKPDTSSQADTAGQADTASQAGPASSAGTASPVDVEEDDEEDCDGEDDEEAKPAMSSGVPAATPNDIPANLPQGGASVLPSDYPASTAEQQVRATVTAHTTVTSEVPSPSIGMLHGNGPSQSAHSSSGTKTEISSLLIAGAAVLFFNL
ncbi:hypothetical protein BJV82DRAFT_669405 [Fennellomyces sp. T-0311]|nr:hypothetical protein BJV82DRAFT_669405 [Fennellomyces sp. T-0311]